VKAVGGVFFFRKVDGGNILHTKFIDIGGGVVYVQLEKNRSILGENNEGEKKRVVREGGQKKGGTAEIA